MRFIRLITRLTLFALFLLFTLCLAATLRLADRLAGSPIDRAPVARQCFRLACRCLGFRVRQLGKPSAEPALYVSNHISWSDIPVLGSMASLRFLSKAEVRNWPVIGWLAGEGGTLFIRRGGGQAAQSRKEITDTLQSGQSVLVFPEGTTTAGLTVLPFHRRLLPAARDAGRGIQPISIGYRRDGQPDHLAPFIGDDAFHSHMVRLLMAPPVEIVVQFHPVVTPTVDGNLEELAKELQSTVTAGLTRILRAQEEAADASGQAAARSTG